MNNELFVADNCLPTLLPQPQHSMSLDERTVLLVVAGFEDRCLAFRECFNATGKAEAIFLEYRPVQHNNKIDKIRHSLDVIGFEESQITHLIFDRMNPEGLIEQLVDFFDKKNIERVWLDISGMSKLAILACLEACKNVELSLFYAEAKEYGPSRKKYEKARLTNRVHQPTSQMQTETHMGGMHHLRCFSSVSMQNAPIAILGFLSFNEKLIQALLNRFNPSHIFLINGRPPELTWREEATAWIYERLLREWSADNLLDSKTRLPERVASTLDYRESFYVLQELYWAHYDQFRIILAPTGSKMQAVGCHLFRSIHQDVHVEYPTPQGYLDEYSKGIGKIWTLPLGRYCDLIEKLQEKDYREHVFIR